MREITDFTPGELHSWFRGSSISPVFSTKSRSATDLAADFQKRRGVNVKTNDSGCKERGREEGREICWRRGRGGGGKKRKEGGGETSRSYGAVTRVAAATRTMTIPFYFPHSLVSLVRAFDFYFSRRPRHFFNPRRSPPPVPARRGNYLETPFRRRTAVYLDVFRDRAIHPYCSASSVGSRFFESRAGRPRGRYLFTVMGAAASISEGWSRREKGFHYFLQSY